MSPLIFRVPKSICQDCARIRFVDRSRFPSFSSTWLDLCAKHSDRDCPKINPRCIREQGAYRYRFPVIVKPFNSSLWNTCRVDDICVFIKCELKVLHAHSRSNCISTGNIVWAAATITITRNWNAYAYEWAQFARGMSVRNAAEASRYLIGLTKRPCSYKALFTFLIWWLLFPTRNELLRTTDVRTIMHSIFLGCSLSLIGCAITDQFLIKHPNWLEIVSSWRTPQSNAMYAYWIRCSCSWQSTQRRTNLVRTYVRTYIRTSKPIVSNLQPSSVWVSPMIEDKNRDSEAIDARHRMTIQIAPESGQFLSCCRDHIISFQHTWASQDIQLTALHKRCNDFLDI